MKPGAGSAASLWPPLSAGDAPSSATETRPAARGKRSTRASAVAWEIATRPAARRTHSGSVRRSISADRRLGRISASKATMSQTMATDGMVRNQVVR
jgi:hypothetical protein